MTRDNIKNFMSAEKWFNGSELAEYFDVEVEERAAVAACASDYFDKYANIPEQVSGTDKKDIVDAVIAEMQNREKERIEAEKQEILADLDDYGI